MKHGPYGPIEGKIGNTVAYIRLGQPILRMIGHPTNKPSTPKQLAARARFALVSEFINTLNLVTNVGFKMKALQTIGKTAQNMAMSANLNYVVDGEYPNYSLNYSAVKLSEGTLTLPENIHVEREGDRLKFSWDTDKNWDYLISSARVMMVAYLPDTKKISYTTSGNTMSSGGDELRVFPSLNPLPGGKKDSAIEVYIAFASIDRENTSDSAYLGRIELP